LGLFVVCAGGSLSQPVVMQRPLRKKREEKEVEEEEQSESEPEVVAAAPSASSLASTGEGLNWGRVETSFDCFGGVGTSSSSSDSEECGGFASEFSGGSSSSEESSSRPSVASGVSGASARGQVFPVMPSNQMLPGLPGLAAPSPLSSLRPPSLFRPTMPFVSPSNTGQEFMMMRQMDSLQRDLREGREKWAREKKARKKAEKKRKKDMKKKERALKLQMEERFAEKEKLFRKLSAEHRALKEENEQLLQSEGEMKEKLGEIKQRLFIVEEKRLADGEKMLAIAEQQRGQLRGMWEEMEKRREGDLKRMVASEADMAAACKSVSEELVAFSEKTKDGAVGEKAMALVYKLEEMRAKGGLVAVSSCFKPFVDSLVFPAVAFQLREGYPLKVFEESDFQKLSLSRLFLEKSSLLKKEQVLVKELYDARVARAACEQPAGSFMLASRRAAIQHVEERVKRTEQRLSGVQAELKEVEACSDSQFSFNFLCGFCLFQLVMLKLVWGAELISRGTASRS